MSGAITGVLMHINTRANDFPLFRVSSETWRGRMHDVALPVAGAYAHWHTCAHVFGDDAEILELRQRTFNVVQGRG